MPPSEHVVIRSILEHNAVDSPSSTAATFEDGSSWSYVEALEQSYRASNRLREAGARQGDRIIVYLPNSADFLRAWWGTTCLGAQMVALNTAWKGEMLRYALELIGAAVVVTNEALHNNIGPFAKSSRIVLAEELEFGDHGTPELQRPLAPWDTHHIQFTSGTTGPSKAAVASFLLLKHTGGFVGDGLDFTPDDTFLCDLPLFHAGSFTIAASCLSRQACIAVRAAPSMNDYWNVAKEAHATFGLLVSSMVGFLLSQPQSDADRDHNMRAMLCAPLPESVDQFKRRFGITDIITAYGSSESGAPIIVVPGIPMVEGSCGRVTPPYEIRVADEHDMEVPVNTAGQLLVRSREPWCVSAEYFNDPAATAAAWRNGWFHTGDQVRVDENSNVFFVDRVTDSLRRRGENISTYEVERAVVTHPKVHEVACVAVKQQDLADDEVKVWLVADDDLVELDLVEFLVDCLPHYMVPRYYERIEELPKTPATRVKKFELRAKGNSEWTWDLEANGYRVTRNGLTALEP